MHHVSRLHRKKTIPDAFTIDEVQDIRAAIKAWESRRMLAGPRPDRQLGRIVEVMLGTSAPHRRSPRHTPPGSRPGRADPDGTDRRDDHQPQG
ncbi:hypothetical protein ACX31A_01825 [Dermacoccus nishinomiyaensis]